MAKTLSINKKHQIKSRIKTGLMHFFLILGSVLMLLPFFWMITTSLQTELEIMNPKMVLFPSSLYFNNFKRALEIIPLFRYMANTAFLAILKMFGEVFITAAVAFGFARFNFKGKNLIFMILLGTMMLPYEVTMIPTFIMWSSIGLTDSYVPLSLPAYFGAASFIFFLRMYFETLPKDLEESALIDGANYFQIFTKIFIPLAKPALITISLWAFMGTWNDLLGQLIYINSPDKYTVQLGLASFNSMSGEIFWGPLMAASFMALVPIIALLLYAQKYFVEGVKMTGIKG